MDGDESNKTSTSGHWQYKPNDAPAVPQPGGDSTMLHRDDYMPQTDGQFPATQPAESVTWTASEFIAHHKSVGWYAILLLATVAVAAGVYFAVHDKISTVVVIVVGIIFGINAARKPRTLKYTVDDSGLTIGDHFYEYARFRSFALEQEGAFSSIVFMPEKRFMPLFTVYYDPKDEQKITDILSDHMPLDTHRLDFIESFMRRIRF